MADQHGWSQSSNGLSAKLIFRFARKDSYARVIHPIILLRNDSSKPIKFLKSIYHAGSFKVKNRDGTAVEPWYPSRSGPTGVEIISIKPKETVEIEAYDYGYGIPTDSSIYVFHAHDYQAQRSPGNYRVDYSMVLNGKKISEIVKSYSWIKDDPRTLWAGRLRLNDVDMVLE